MGLTDRLKGWLSVKGWKDYLAEHRTRRSIELQRDIERVDAIRKPLERVFDKHVVKPYETAVAKPQVAQPQYSGFTFGRRPFVKGAALFLGLLGMKLLGCSTKERDPVIIPPGVTLGPATVEKTVPLYTGIGTNIGQLTETDWDALASSTLLGVGYAQTFNLFDQTTVQYSQDANYVTRDFLHSTAEVQQTAPAVPIFEWQASFAGGMTAASDLSDLVDTNFNILGKAHRIVNASVSGNRVSLDTMSFEDSKVLNELNNEQQTYTADGKNYNVQVWDISKNIMEDYVVSFTVGTQVFQLKKGEVGTATDGQTFGILNVNENTEDIAADSAEIAIGTRKVFMDDSDITDTTYESNVYIDGSYAPQARGRIQGSILADNRVQIDSIGYQAFAHGTIQDDLFVEEGNSMKNKQSIPKQLLADVAYGGLEALTGNEMLIEFVNIGNTVGRGYELGFTNNQGIRYVTPFVFNDLTDPITALHFGSKNGNQVVVSELTDGRTGDLFFVTGQNDETRVYELTSFNKTLKSLMFRDLGTGEYTASIYNPTSGVSGINFNGNTARIEVNETNDTVKMDVNCDGVINQASAVIQTMYGGFIDTSAAEFTALGDINMSLVTPQASFTETTETQDAPIYFRILNGTNGTTDIQHIPASAGPAFADNSIPQLYNDPSDNLIKGMSKFGVKEELTDLTNGNNVTFYYPPEQRTGKVTVKRNN